MKMNKNKISICIALMMSANIYAADFQVQVNSLHYATSINEAEYVSKLIKEDPKLASQLNAEGLTPIHIAIKKNNLISLKAIFEEKINPNIKNSNEETPLIYSIKLNKPKAVAFLLSVGANKNIEDSLGFNATYYAEKSTPTIKELFFPKKREIIYQEDTSGINTEEFNNYKKEIDKQIEEIKNLQAKVLKETELKFQEFEDKSRIKTSVLAGSIQKTKNDLEIMKLENEDLKTVIKTLQTENNEKNLIIWQNELNIKQLKEETKEFKRKQLMGIYSSGEDVPETNPIVNINKESKTIDRKDDTLSLLTDSFEEINIDEVIVEESVILDFSPKK